MAGTSLVDDPMDKTAAGGPARFEAEDGPRTGGCTRRLVFALAGVSGVVRVLFVACVWTLSSAGVEGGWAECLRGVAADEAPVAVSAAGRGLAA